MIQRKQRKENNIWIKQKQKYSTKKPMYWHGYVISEVPYVISGSNYVISEARRFLEAYVISGGI